MRNRIILSFVVICAACLGLHAILVHKKMIRTQRWEVPAPGQVQRQEEAPPEQGLAIGTVTSLSADRFYVNVGSRRMGFEIPPGGKLPPMGQQVRIYYESGGQAGLYRVVRLETGP
ncbi:MAG: hypothetical protein AB1758_37460 [Candidatus Eremiobacterota bacterium]